MAHYTHYKLLLFAGLTLGLDPLILSNRLDAQAPAQTKQRQGPETVTTSSQIDTLIAQLGSKDFKQREAASKALEAIGHPALGPLRNVAAQSKDPETRQRARGLVQRI